MEGDDKPSKSNAKKGKGKKKQTTQHEPEEIIERQPSLTIGYAPENISGDLAEDIGRMSVASSSSGSTVRSPMKKKPKAPGNKSGKSEEEEDERETKRKRARASADDAFAELTELTGIDISNPPSSLCLRPAYENGRNGAKVPVLTNFYSVKMKGDIVHKYDVVFETPQMEKEEEVGRKFKRLTKRMNQSLLSTFISSSGAKLFEKKYYAYDNDRILITNTPLDVPKEGKAFAFEFPDPPKMLKVRVTLKPTVKLALTFNKDNNLGFDYIDHNQAVLQVIDIISKSHAFKNEIVYGTKIFLSNPNKRRQDLIIGREPYVTSTPFEIASGYHQSTRLCEGGVMQNIDRATAVLFKGGPMIKAICRLLKVSEDQLEINNKNFSLLDDLTHIRVQTTYRGYPATHMVKAFSTKSADDIYIQNENGRKSVTSYFRETYNINLEFSHLPCIVYGQRPNERHIPVELCEILPNQRYQKKLREELIRVVSQHTTSQKPFQRSAGCSEIAKFVASQLETTAFNIQLVPNQISVESRILDSPTLQYKNDPKFKPTHGDWTMQKQDKSMLKLLDTKKLSNWALVSYQSRKIEPDLAKRFVDNLKRTGADIGMEISDPANPYTKLLSVDQLTSFFRACQTKNVQLIMVIISESAENYSRVKYLGDQCLGVPTQVVLDKHYNPRAPPHLKQKLFDAAYLCNLLLKVNTKLGGKNLKLGGNFRSPILTDKTMVVGIDVNHPSPGESSRSIAAVVGSIDAEFMRYRTEIEANQERDELVNVYRMIKPIMKKFNEVRGFYPDNIVVYRDGVSEGQFAHVMGHEILPLHKELEKCPSRPKLTYMIVQKRHNARFFPTDKNKQTRSQNILPGSVIDTNVVHYKWFDFYLCSQNALLGTACPAKYTVLWNSGGASADEIQLATYYLCYLFARATKSIADPAPARYAHHAAARGKIHFREIVRAREWTDQQVNAEINRAINVNDSLKHILYFI